LDDSEVTPLQPNPSRVWLPLPGKAGIRFLRLRWVYDSADRLDRPNLAQPTVVDAVAGPSLWTVMVPPGWEVERSDSAISLGSGAMREAALALHRAEVQLRISQDLCRQRRDRAQSQALVISARRFADATRHARQVLEVAGQRSEAEGSQGAHFVAWLTRLQAEYRELVNQNDLEQPGLESAAQKERPREGTSAGADENNSEHRTYAPRGWNTSALGKGTPLSWQAQPGEGPLVLQLASRESEQQRQALVHSGLWLGGLVVVWILSFVPFLRTRLCRFWPEQIALIGLLGWYLAGLTTVVVFLIFVGLLGRLSLLIRGLRSLLVARHKEPSTITSGSANRP
jgi:hypothetical protein